MLLHYIYFSKEFWNNSVSFSLFLLHMCAKCYSYINIEICMYTLKMKLYCKFHASILNFSFGKSNCLYFIYNNFHRNLFIYTLKIFYFYKYTVQLFLCLFSQVFSDFSFFFLFLEIILYISKTIYCVYIIWIQVYIVLIYYLLVLKIYLLLHFWTLLYATFISLSRKCILIQHLYLCQNRNRARMYACICMRGNV